MPKLEMTYKLALAIAQDKAEGSMRKAGRKTWNQADYGVLVEEFHRLWPCPQDVPCPYCLANLSRSL